MCTIIVLGYHSAILAGVQNFQVGTCVDGHMVQISKHTEGTDHRSSVLLMCEGIIKYSYHIHRNEIMYSHTDYIHKFPELCVIK